MEHWYAVHTKPKAEFRVAQAARKREFEVFMPEILVTRPDSRRIGMEPFFPCYLFIRTGPVKISPLLNEWTPGLRGIVTYGGEPVPIPDYVIEAIKRQLDNETGQQEKQATHLQEGDVIRVTKGPFADMKGIFNGPTTPDKRVQVLLRLLGQLSRVWLEADHIVKVASATHALVPNKRGRRTRGRGRSLKSFT